MTLSFASLVGFSQEQDPFIPRWVSQKGFWVVESNKSTPKDHIVRFYNNNNEMVYKETVSGVRLNLNRARVKMKLKKTLESAVLAYEKKKAPLEEMALLKNNL